MEKLKVEYVDIGELKPYKNNAKLHTQEQIDQIKESISQFGMNDPIGIWKDGLIIEGHGRWMALCEMGAKEVPVIHLDHLSDEERRAYTLAHNKLTTNTGYDLELLDFELDGIEDIDMTAFGFDAPILEDDYGTDFTLPDGDKNEICQMTFTLHEEQKGLIEYAIELVKGEITETFGNTNGNGNALYEVVRQWAEQRK